jgi:hypothetical protein
VKRFIATFFAATFAWREAHACQRPSDPGGFNGYDYAPDPALHFDGTKVRIWYTTTGPHAVNTTTTRMDMVPDNVAKAAAVADDALVRYKMMGFVPPISDGTCGGDDRVDIYLMHFNAADGDASTDACTNVGAARTCSTFCLVEAKIENESYGSFDVGAHVVIPHELFHATQNAYDSKLDRFWAEGTAQWAAKTLDPTTMDFEGFLPDFFASATRSIDIVSGGVTSGYIYGAAIFPFFLSLRTSNDVVRLALEQEAMLGPPSMNAISPALDGLGTSMANEFPTFAAWNLATGSRAGTGGYPNGKAYPMVKNIPTFPDGGASDIATGFSVFYWSYDFGAAPQVLTLAGDPARVGARVVPLDANGKAQVDQIATLPATVTTPGILVVAGVSSKKTDAPFTVTVGPPAMAMPDAGVAVDGGTMKKDGGGCSVDGSRDASTWSAAIALLAVLRRHRSVIGQTQRRSRSQRTR